MEITSAHVTVDGHKCDCAVEHEQNGSRHTYVAKMKVDGVEVASNEMDNERSAISSLSAKARMTTKELIRLRAWNAGKAISA